MTSTFQTGIVWLKKGSQRATKEIVHENLLWSLQPMLVTLRIFGIDVQWNLQRSSTCKYLIIFNCIIWFIINVAVVAEFATNLYQSITVREQQQYEKITRKIILCFVIIETAGIYEAD